MVISHGGINWTWYTWGALTTEGFRIDGHGRRHNGRDSHPVPDVNGALIEDADRTVTHVRIGTMVLPVVNPRYVFGYDDKEE